MHTFLQSTVLDQKILVEGLIIFRGRLQLNKNNCIIFVFRQAMMSTTKKVYSLNVILSSVNSILYGLIKLKIILYSHDWFLSSSFNYTHKKYNEQICRK